MTRETKPQRLVRQLAEIEARIIEVREIFTMIIGDHRDNLVNIRAGKKGRPKSTHIWNPQASAVEKIIELLEDVGEERSPGQVG